MTIYCSKKLEVFLGQTSIETNPAESSIFGDWNGHLFTVDRKRFLIFMNNRTCYCIVFANVRKNNLKDFVRIFRERLIAQLDHDMELSEGQEIRIRRDLAKISLTKSNNDKKIIGTINHHIENLKYSNYRDGFPDLNEFQVTEFLNNSLVGTKILPNMKRNRDFFIPVELMMDLVRAESK